MTIEDDSVVDGIGTDRETGAVVLVISDHLDWADEPLHFRLLEKKIGAYLDFVGSGQLADRMPAAAGQPVSIELICQFDPSPKASRFLDAAKAQLLQDEGMLLEWKVLPPRLEYRAALQHNAC